MHCLRQLDALPARFRRGAVTIGNFDGVHRGHAHIIQRLRAQAAAVGGPAIVFTFDPHPVRLLRPQEAPPPLTWTDRKAELLAELGIDLMIAYPTDEALLRLTAREFYDQLLRGRLDARALVEGPNFFFGRDRGGTIELLGKFCREDGLSLEVVQPVLESDSLVSSSRIRQLLMAGDVDAACRLLTQPYRIRGLVTHGAGRGARIGFPTANLAGIDTLLPGPGVYAARARLTSGTHPAAVNIGPNPTFGESALKVEVHVIDIDQQLYGQPLEVDFLSRLRGVQTFASLEALQTQLRADVARAAKIAGS